MSSGTTVKRDGNQIWVSMGITKNIGNYESIRFDAGATKVVDDPHDEKEWAALWTKIDDEIEGMVREAGLE